jgi:cell division protein FtsI/penicillin-binding protein 2
MENQRGYMRKEKKRLMSLHVFQMEEYDEMRRIGENRRKKMIAVVGKLSDEMGERVTRNLKEEQMKALREKKEEKEKREWRTRKRVSVQLEEILERLERREMERGVRKKVVQIL